MRLKVGDIIEVHGWVMLKGLVDGGKYKVTRIEKTQDDSIYFFSKARGNKEIIGHYAYNIDMMINSNNGNRIEIIG